MSFLPDGEVGHANRVNVMADVILLWIHVGVHHLATVSEWKGGGWSSKAMASQLLVTEKRLYQTRVH